MSPIFTDRKEARRGNYCTHSHKPVQRGAGNGVKESRGSISLCGKGRYEGEGCTMAKQEE